MSVQTEIDRLETAKAAIGTAIAGKGVAVPSGTKLDGMAALINGIEQGSDPVLQSKTVSPTTSSQTVKPDSGYDGLSQVTVNAMPTATQATPSISVSSAGLITASATQSAGYVTAGTKKATKQLTVQAAQTITPGTANKTIASGRYLTGTQTIKGDSNLVAGNIKSGVSIFGVAGTFEGSGGGGGGGSVETCTVIGRDLEGIAYYSDGTQVLSDEMSFYLGDPISVAKNSVLCFEHFSAANLKYQTLETSGDIEVLAYYDTFFVVAIYGDCTMELVYS